MKFKIRAATPTHGESGVLGSVTVRHPQCEFPNGIRGAGLWHALCAWASCQSNDLTSIVTITSTVPDVQLTDLCTHVSDIMLKLSADIERNYGPVRDDMWCLSRVITPAGVMELSIGQSFNLFTSLLELSEDLKVSGFRHINNMPITVEQLVASRLMEFDVINAALDCRCCRDVSDRRVISHPATDMLMAQRLATFERR